MSLVFNIPLEESQDILDMVDDIDEDFDDFLDEETEVFVPDDYSFITEGNIEDVLAYFDTDSDHLEEIYGEEYIGAAWGKSTKSDAVDGFTGGKAPSYRQRWRTRMKMLNKTKHVTKTEKERQKARKAKMKDSKRSHREKSERVRDNIREGQN